MKRSSLAIILSLMILSAASAGCSGPATTKEGSQAFPAQDTGTAEQRAVAHAAAASINAGLTDIKRGLADTSQSLTGTGISGTGAEDVLNKNLLQYPWTLSSFVITKDGIVTAAAPAQYRKFVGLNLSYQTANLLATEKKAPMVSSVFPMVEGFNAVSQSCPVYSAGGEYLGHVDVTYRPQTFLSRQIGNVTFAKGFDIWVAQEDGTQLYDVNEEEVGKNIVTDPLYADPVLHEVLARIASEPVGTGSYSFWDRDWNRTITKIAVWETAGIDGAEWRVVVTREAGTATAGTAPALSATPAVTGTTGADARYGNLVQFVDRAVAYAKEHGKEAAVAEFNNVKGRFIDGDLYIFAYETGGTVIALPYQQGVLGTDRRGIADSNGVLFIDRLIEVAREGGGSVYYLYPNPADNYREEFKISYIQPVDSTWFVGSGIYLPEVPAQFNTSEKDQLVERVKRARQYAQVHGAAKAIHDFNDRNGTFSDGSRYIFAYGFNGTTLAMPFQPEAIGTDRTGFTDTWGVRVAAWEIAVAKGGGGFVYVHYFNPDTGKAGLKLCYVVPVDDTWLVGSGIYTDRQ